MLEILENLRDPVAIIRGDKHLFVNQAYTELFGYTIDDLAVREGFEFLVATRDRDRSMERYRTLLEGEHYAEASDVEIIARNGRLIPCEATVKVVDLDGMPALFVSFRDRTHQRNLERTLELVTSNILDLVALCDRKGIFSYVSPSYEQTLGVSPRELLGKPIFALVHPDDFSSLLEILQQDWTQPNSVTATYRMRHADGRYLWFETVGRVIFTEANEPDGAVFCTRDITDRQQSEREREELERRLFQSQKMEAIGRLAGGIAHDFNNLLTGIVGYLDLVEAGVGDLPEVLEDIAEIRHSSDRAANLVNQLLTFSRTQTSGRVVINLDEAIKSSIRLLERIVGENTVISFSPESSERNWNIKADPSQIDQILVNLATNARDAMPSGGRLCIRTRNVPAGTMGSGPLQGSNQDWVALEVSDEGEGVEEEIREQIFEPFFSTKEAGKGTGLGLATVYGIVKQNGGMIHMDSPRGGGTTFTIVLPRVNDSVAPLENDSSFDAVPKGGGEMILLVEDEEIIRSLATKVLEREGYSIIAVENAKEAREIFKKRKDEVVLLLTDVVMPGDDGFTLYTNLSSLRSDLKVLFMSGYSEGVVDIAQIGEGRFISKPFSTAALLKKVAGILAES